IAGGAPAAKLATKLGGCAAGRQHYRGLRAVEASVGRKVQVERAERTAQAQRHHVLLLVGVGERLIGLDVELGRLVGDGAAAIKRDLAALGNEVVVAEEGNAERALDDRDLAGEVGVGEQATHLQMGVQLELVRDIVVDDQRSGRVDLQIELHVGKQVDALP